jgi:hypothetical protein
MLLGAAKHLAKTRNFAGTVLSSSIPSRRMKAQRD